MVDNASDAFDANESSRRDVRAFVRVLGAIARDNNAALVLLAHIDKAAAKGMAHGNNYSGSTAWHNSARSRLALTEPHGRTVLIHEKANLSKLADPLSLAFVGGVLIPAASGATSDESGRAILLAMAAAAEVGFVVPASLVPGAHCAITAPKSLPE